MNSFSGIKWALVAAVMVVASLSASPTALAYEPEIDLLAIKGYSPQNIDAIQLQRSRQEWKEPSAPLRTPIQQFWHNAWQNDWTGSVDEFGRSVIREQM